MVETSSKSMSARIREWVLRPRVRGLLKFLGLAVVVIGAVWSFLTLELKWHALSPGLLLLNLLVLTPLNLGLAAIAFWINARAIGCVISAQRCFFTVAAANVAELLPLPGGALVRGAALVNAGASLAQSTRITVLASALTLFLTLSVSLGALALLTDLAWGWLALVSLVGLIFVLFALSRFMTGIFVLSMVFIRILIVALTLLRIAIAFATLGTMISWTEAALYTIAPTLGATIGIVPAGLGVNEAIAAGLAVLVASPAASAFLAIALNRVLGLSVGAMLVFVATLFQGTKGR